MGLAAVSQAQNLTSRGVSDFFRYLLGCWRNSMPQRARFPEAGVPESHVSRARNRRKLRTKETHLSRTAEPQLRRDGR